MAITRLSVLFLALAFAGAKPLPSQVLNATGPHANEAFCKTMITQFVNMQTDMKSSFGREPDVKAQAKYFADQKALNGLLVKTAPPSLSADMKLIDRNVKTAYDAMLHADRGHMMAAMAPMRHSIAANGPAPCGSPQPELVKRNSCAGQPALPV